jgi:hypothetical protein
MTNLLKQLANKAIQRLPTHKPKRRDRQKMTRLDLRRKVLNGHLPVTFQVAEAERIGLGFMIDRKGYVELGGGDA